MKILGSFSQNVMEIVQKALRLQIKLTWQIPDENP